jgi:glycosyltransferase involved in cell wall biosynthesis
LSARYKLTPLYIPHAIGQAKWETIEGRATSEPVGIYMGTFYPVWDYDLVFDALKLLAGQGLFPRIEFIGDGPDLERWKNFASRFSLRNILLSGYLSDDEMKRRLRSAHYLLFPIRDTPFNQTRCPSKLFAYAQSQRPILTNRVGEVPEILGESPIYLPATPRAFAETIQHFSVTPRRPDVDYKIGRHTYSRRAETLHSEMTRLGWVSKS